jgi:subtilisin family serine protease
MEEQFVIFEVKSGEPTRGDFGFDTAAEEPPEVAVQLETLGPAEVADAKQNPQQIIARELPTRLLKPVSVEETAGPAAAGVSWGVEAVGANQSPFTGEGIKVAVLDTGVDADHPAFQELQVTQRDFTGEGDGDEHGHGTHCAGTIAGRDVSGFRFGVAPGVTELFAGKVLGRDGGTTLAIAQGVHWAVDSGANVISMSLGIDFPGAVERFVQQGIQIQPATSRALEAYRENLRLFDAIAEYVRASAAFGRSALIVAATGNESERTAADPYTIDVAPPAAAEGFIAVGAVGQDAEGGLGIARFSNAGAHVVAPGVDIPSAKPGGGFVKMSGTSMATPHAAGVAALWAEKLVGSVGRLDPRDLAGRLTGNSQSLAGLLSSDMGSGLVTAPLA